MAKRGTPRGGVTDSGRSYADANGLSLNQVKGLTDADVAGLIVVQDNTDLISNLLKKQKAAALEEIGLVAEGYAKRLCPVDTGRLRNSITHAIDPTEDVAIIGTNVEYGPAVEYGTSSTDAQPFLHPAARDHADKYRQILEKHLKS